MENAQEVPRPQEVALPQEVAVPQEQAPRREASRPGLWARLLRAFGLRRAEVTPAPVKALAAPEVVPPVSAEKLALVESQPRR